VRARPDECRFTIDRSRSDALLPDSFLGIMFGSLLLSVLAAGVGVYLTPYLNLSICRFYLLATAPQVNEPPHFDSWNDNF